MEVLDGRIARQSLSIENPEHSRSFSKRQLTAAKGYTIARLTPRIRYENGQVSDRLDLALVSLNNVPSVVLLDDETYELVLLENHHLKNQLRVLFADGDIDFNHGLFQPSAAEIESLGKEEAERKAEVKGRKRAEEMIQSSWPQAAAVYHQLREQKGVRSRL